jgi:hypothetical protein
MNMSNLKIGSAGASGVGRYGGDATAGSVGGGDDSSGATLLPDPALSQLANSGDFVAMLAAVMTQMARQDRDSSRKDERQAAEVAWQQGEAKVRDLQDKADHIRAEGWTEGLTTMAQGACDIGGGLCGTDKAGDRAASIWRGSGEGFASLGKIGGNEFKAQATLDDARADHDGNAKEVSERFVKLHHESLQDARDLLRKIAQWYSDMKKAQESTVQAALHRA